MICDLFIVTKLFVDGVDKGIATVGADEKLVGHRVYGIWYRQFVLLINVVAIVDGFDNNHFFFWFVSVDYTQGPGA